MTDEPKPRRALTHRDHRRSDPRGYPVHVETEQTPPPIDLEEVRRVTSTDTIPTPLGEQVMTIATWVDKLSGERTNASRLDRIEERLVAIAKSVTVHETVLGELKPQLDRWRATTDDLAQQLPRLLVLVEGLTLHVRSIDDRMRSLELDVRALTERNREHATDIEAAAERETALVARVYRLEQLERDRETTQLALSKVEQKKSRTAGGAAGGVLGAIISAVIAAIAAAR